MRLGRHPAEFAGPVGAGQRDDAQRIGPGLEQQLRDCVQQHAGNQKRKSRQVHCRLVSLECIGARPFRSICVSAVNGG
jgi:hypothetical protein